ncbi:MAG: acyltransferase [Nitrospinae bacterium]|nr:acyltransferase [Nitrospinota bacterium]
MPILDIFRFIAASLVFFGHYSFLFGVETISKIFTSSALSWFFVVSGFVLCYRYPKLHPSDIKKFYLYRVVRIYPLYFLALLFGGVLTIISVSKYGNDYFSMVGRAPMGSYDLPEVISLTFWVEAITKHLFFFQLVSETQSLKFIFNPPLWSLANEAFFYLFFPLLLLFTGRVEKIKHVFIVLVLLYILEFCLVQLFLPEANNYDWYNVNTPIYTNPLIRIVEFIMGMLLYQAYSYVKNKGVKSIFSSYLLLLVILVSYTYTMQYNISMPIQYRQFLFGLPMILLMVYSLIQVNWQPQGLIRTLSIHSGGASYVIYCFHWPIMELCRLYGIEPRENLVMHCLTLYFLLVLLSFAIHFWLETPVRHLILKWLGYDKKHKTKS